MNWNVVLSVYQWLVKRRKAMKDEQKAARDEAKAEASTERKQQLAELQAIQQAVKIAQEAAKQEIEWAVKQWQGIADSLRTELANVKSEAKSDLAKAQQRITDLQASCDECHEERLADKQRLGMFQIRIAELETKFKTLQPVTLPPNVMLPAIQAIEVKEPAVESPS